MGKKLTLEYIKSEIEKCDYKCLSEEYVNNHTKLKLQCDKGHVYEATWSVFQRGCRCLICSGKIKKTIEEIKEHIEKFGYECFSIEYVNAHTKLELMCNIGHIYEAVWGNFQQGQRCPICVGLKKKSIKEIKEYIESFGYECLSEIYINANSNLDIKCSEGHIYKASWHTFQQGKRCLVCSGKIKKTIEEVKEYVEKFGYECLSKEYINSSSKLKIQCDKGHQYKVSWCHLGQGSKCPVCKPKNNSGENHPNWKYYTEEDRKNIVLYRAEVTQLSNINYIKYFYSINPNKLERSYYTYHLDHIYSVRDGFNNGILPEIISSPVNLQMLWWLDNISKNGISHMALEQLYNLHEQFNKELIK